MDQESQEHTSAAANPDTTDGLGFVWTALPIAALVFATAVLSRGRDVLLPLTMAFILAVICGPLGACPRNSHLTLDEEGQE